MRQIAIRLAAEIGTAIGNAFRFTGFGACATCSLAAMAASEQGAGHRRLLRAANHSAFQGLALGYHDAHRVRMLGRGLTPPYDQLGPVQGISRHEIRSRAAL